MSRNIIYQDEILTAVEGLDHAFGQFYQLFDKEMENETPEGEGLVLDWSDRFGFEVNRTGIPNSENINKMIVQYIEESKSNRDQSVYDGN